MDWFDFTDFDAAVHLLRAAPFRTEYSIPLPPNWRADPATHAAAREQLEYLRWMPSPREWWRLARAFARGNYPIAQLRIDLLP